MNATLIDRSLRHIWHPCSQMKDYEQFKPLLVQSAKGSYIELADGRKIIDAISSWWCKSLGHNHPRLQQALLKQMHQFEHVIFANTTNETIIVLSEKLAGLTHSLKKVFYAGDGSSAVEIAMKMSLHARQIKGETKKTKFIALQNGYHGETLGALSVSDLGLYKKPYDAVTLDVFFLSPIPYVLTTQDPLWQDAEIVWQQAKSKLEKQVETTTAIIVEPIVQGAAGMKIYSQDFLKKLRKWCYENNIHFIADEIMTGLGRTGKMLACQHAGIEPDFICLSKGLTSGWMPFSAVLTTQEMYQTFYDDYAEGKAFLHSHTYSGHALAAIVAIEVLTIIEELQLCNWAQTLGSAMFHAMNEIADETKKLQQVRQLGAIVAADLKPSSKMERQGFYVQKKAAELGALLRPLGDTIYWLPPLNTDLATIENLKNITQQIVFSLK